MVDLHCHILPGIDDGASSWEVAVEMCKMAWQDGITHIVASPHANNRFHYDRSAFTPMAEELNRRTNKRPSVSLGCDFHLSYENFLEVLKNPAQFTVGTTQYLLVELDDYSVPVSISANFEKLISTGLIPIITHPERNPVLQGNALPLLDWISQGCLVQLTADSVTGRWGKKARSTAEWLLKRNAVHVIATDAHGIGSRPPILSKARDEVAKMIGHCIAEALVNDNPLAITKGQKVKHSCALIEGARASY